MSKFKSNIRRVVNYILNSISIFNEFVYRNTGIGFTKFIGIYWRCDEKFPRMRVVTKTEYLKAKRSLEKTFKEEKERTKTDVKLDLEELFYQYELYQERERRKAARLN